MRRQQIPWDGGYHLLFEHPRLMKDLLRGFVPREVLEEVDVEGMEWEKTDFYNDHFKKRDGDVLVKLRRRDGGDAYLWFLLEFQVRSERFMSVRVGTYIFWLYEHLMRTLGLGATGQLPPVFAMVFYHGAERWKAPEGLDGLIDLPHGSPLWAWQPQVKFWLLEEQRVDAQGVSGGENLASALIGLNQCRTGRDFALAIEHMGRVLSKDGDRELRRLLVEWIKIVLLKKHKVELSQQEIEPLLEGESVGLEHHVDAIVEDFKRMGREEGLERGLEQGLEQGLEKGLEKGRKEGRHAALMTVLEARFGASDDWEGVVEAVKGCDGVGEALRLASTAVDKEAFEAGLQALLDGGC